MNTCNQTTDKVSGEMDNMILGLNTIHMVKGSTKYRFKSLRMFAKI